MRITRHALPFLLAHAICAQPTSRPTEPTGVRLTAKLLTNETAAVATLRNIASAQAQCQASGVIDVDGNGFGEYGYFGELAGVAGVRNRKGMPGELRISPPVLSAAYGEIDENGRCVRSGYYFAMFLPDKSSKPIRERDTRRTPHPNQAERVWCCYAWPTEYGNTGELAFYIDQQGHVVATKNDVRKYSGSENAPNAGAVHQRKNSRMDGPVELLGHGQDGQRWRLWQTEFAGRRSVRAEGSLGKLVGKLSGTAKRRRAANESAALATLRNISTAQAQVRLLALIDDDRDGRGEFAYFAELAGTVPIRTGHGRPLNPPYLSRVFGHLEEGVVVRRGYCFSMFLPDDQSRPLAESARGGAAKTRPHANRAEHKFCCYAWPLEYGDTGHRAFFIDAEGRLMASSNEHNKYSGTSDRPDGLAAFTRGAESMMSTPANGRIANDSERWSTVDNAKPR